MRTTIKLLPIALLVMLLTGFTASASAQNVTITNEATGNPCPDGPPVTGTDVDGGCLIHGISEGNVEIRKHIFGIESHITSCTLEYSARTELAGFGYVSEQVLAGASCSRRACRTSTEGDPWDFTHFEGTAAGPLQEGTEYTDLHFCIEPSGGGTDEQCSIAIPFQSYENGHRLEYGHAGEMGWHSPTGFFCELVGHWTTEVGGTHDGQPEQEVIVVHDDD